MNNNTFHFIPANKPHLFPRMESLSAKNYILDLEDAVPLTEKGKARNNIKALLKKSSRMDISNIFIRINEFGTTEYIKDIQLIKEIGHFDLVIPKVENVKIIDKICKEFKNKGIKIIALIEGFLGLENISSIAKNKYVIAIGLGLEDMFSSIMVENIHLTKLSEIIRLKVVMTCKAYNILSIDIISYEFYDFFALEKECLDAKNMGFNSKFSIHPNQINIINRVFAIDEKLYSWAQKIEKISNLNNGFGYKNNNGFIITPPKIKKAKTIIKTINK